MRFHSTLNKHHTLENTGKYRGKHRSLTRSSCYRDFQSKNFHTRHKENQTKSLRPQICQSGNPVFSPAGPSRSGPRHGWCPHRRGHCAGMKAAPNWPTEKPPASGCSALPPNRQSKINADINTQNQLYTQKNGTTACLEINNNKCLSVWVKGVLFLDTSVLAVGSY